MRVRSFQMRVHNLLVVTVLGLLPVACGDGVGTAGGSLHHRRSYTTAGQPKVVDEREECHQRIT